MKQESGFPPWGHIELVYPLVFRYSFGLNGGAGGHRDWRYDELHLSEDGHLIHEIEWWDFEPTPTARWTIEASDLEYRWLPTPTAP